MKTLCLDATNSKNNYLLLSSLITPRPIAWITTQSTPEQGSIVNLAPFSFFNLMGANPPIVALAPGNKDAHTPKDTARNIEDTGEFVIHTVTPELAQAMVQSAKPLEFGLSELDELELRSQDEPLQLLPSDLLSVPRLAQAPVALECRHHSTLHIGKNRIVIGTIHRLHIQDELMDPSNPESINLESYQPIGRMAAPNWYCHTHERFQI